MACQQHSYAAKKKREAISELMGTADSGPGERLKARLAELGHDQGWLAEALGVSQSAISQIITGQTRRSRLLPEIAMKTGVSLEYLLGQSDDPLPHSLRDSQIEHGRPPSESGETVELEEFDLSYGLGSTFIHDVPVTGVRRTFSRAWIRNFTGSPMEYLFFASGIGDSMIPTILDADIVLIDTFDRTPRFADKLWAIEVGGLGSIKRLRPTKDGSGMRLLSSNPDVPEEVVYDEEMRVVGRVAGIFRKT